MKTLEMEHIIHCSVDEFWSIFLDAEYTRALFLDVLDFPEFEILSVEETNTQIVRVCAAQPALSAMQTRMLRAFGAPFRFVERGVFDKDRRVWTWRLEANLFSTAMKNEGVVEVRATENRRVKRKTTINLAANLPIVGALMEVQAAFRQQAGWDASAKFLNETWLASRR